MAILSAGQWQEVQRGGFYFREGEPSSTVYLLNSGRVKLFQVTAGGSETLVRFVSRGGIFGRSALSPFPKRYGFAQAFENSRAIVWTQETMIRLIREYPALSFKIIEDLNRSMKELRERYVFLSTQCVERRVAWTLLKLGQQTEPPTENILVIPTGFKAKDLAEMAGTTIYTVSRVLSEWERKGVLTKTNRHIVVLRPAILTELAEQLA